MRIREWTWGSLTAEAVSAAAGVTLVDHSHDSAHAILVIEGHFTDDGCPYGPGDVRVSSAADRHFVRFRTQTTCLLLTAVDHASLPVVSERWSGPVVLPQSGLLAAMARSSRRSVAPTEGELGGLVSGLLVALDRQRDDLETCVAPTWLRELRAHVATGHEMPGSVAHAARRAGVSGEHLARAFRRYYGTSFVTYRRHQRVTAASRLLKTTVRPLADIAVACGFADQSHMTRAFVQCLDRTPGALRSLVHQDARSQTFKPTPARATTLGT